MGGKPVRAALERWGAPDPNTQAFNDRLEAVLAAAPPPWTTPVDAVRKLRAQGGGAIPVHGPLPEGDWIAFDPTALGPEAAAAASGPRRLRVIESEGAPKALILHLHGGGWTFGAAEQSDGRCLRLARETGALSVSIPYRLAPENPWPACGDDALAGALWGLEEAERRGGLPVFMTGESAGAHLALLTLLRLRALGRLAPVRGAMLLYGCYDLRMTPSLRNWGARNLVLSTPIVEWFCGNLLGSGGEGLAAAPSVSPLLADLSGMPPAVFQVGSLDPLLDDSLFMAERWRAAGSEATLSVWPGAIHGFDYFDRPEDALPIALACQQATADFMRERL